MTIFTSRGIRSIGVALFAAWLIVGFTGSAAAQTSRPAGVPEAGKSERIDEILKRGTIKVGVTPSFPWLFRNKTGKGDDYRGSSWVLAKAYADALGVKLEPVQVSNETKVPIVVSGGVDMTISSLAETDARKQVVDFVTYSRATFCIFGLKTNPKAAAVKSIEQLNDSNLTFAAYVGTNQAAWIPKTFPKAQIRGVTGSGQAPVDELLSGRADFVVGDYPQEPDLQECLQGHVLDPDDCTTSHLQRHPGRAGDRQEPAGVPRLRSRVREEERREDQAGRGRQYQICQRAP